MSVLSIALLLWLEQYLELRRYSKPFLNLRMNDYSMVGRPGKLFAEVAAAVLCSPAQCDFAAFCIKRCSFKTLNLGWPCAASLVPAWVLVLHWGGPVSLLAQWQVEVPSQKPHHLHIEEWGLPERASPCLSPTWLQTYERAQSTPGGAELSLPNWDLPKLLIQRMWANKWLMF